ncbi:hypothetical protein OC842_005573 [Tilletia horrida]|uniref:Uncharacterized protein n=1 Tax=Tilletia horrida TaxID=155126 RepID=A0AAN6JIB7_9BASI|nr:hypothetical protein OC842_005573 [Tilletia horrida]
MGISESSEWDVPQQPGPHGRRPNDFTIEKKDGHNFLPVTADDIRLIFDLHTGGLPIMRDLDADDTIVFVCLHCDDTRYPHYTSLLRHLQAPQHPTVPGQAQGEPNPAFQQIAKAIEGAVISIAKAIFNSSP